MSRRSSGRCDRRGGPGSVACRGLLASAIDWRGFFLLLAGIGVIVTVAVSLGFAETLTPGSRTAGGLRAIWSPIDVLARDRLFVGATLSSSLTSAAYFAYLAGAPFVLQNIYALSPAHYALIFGINAAGFAAFGFTAGRAAERWSERRVFAAGLLLLVASGITLTLSIAVALPLPVTLAAFFLISSGAAAVSPPATTLALVDYPQYAGTASAVLGLSRFAAGESPHHSSVSPGRRAWCPSPSLCLQHPP